MGGNIDMVRGKYTAVVFDFFGVLCSPVAPRWLANHCDRQREAEVRERILRRTDKGEITQKAMFEALALISGSNAGAVEGEWHALAAIDDEMLSLVVKLRSRFTIGLLTNASSPFVRSILRRADIEKLFDCIVVSSECGFAKPDESIYGLLLNSLGVRASAVLFIDDTLDNVFGARRLGMTGIHFQSARELERLFGED
jgi:putative hydrolase of the HAD superfamily